MYGTNGTWQSDNTTLEGTNNSICCDGIICITDMMHVCHNNKLVVPSLESLLGGPKTPKSHMVFYDICVKPVTGNTAWKNTLRNPLTDGINFGTPTDCAFACIILENNYDSWITKGEELHFDLVTEYDDLGNGHDRQLYTEWRTKMEYDPEAKNLDDYSVKEGDNSRFLAMRNARFLAFQDLHNVIRGTRETGEKERSSNSDIPSEMKKKRNLNQMSKKYTKGGSGRKRYGGWSDVAHARLEEVCKNVKDDRQRGLYRFFNEAVHTWQREEMEMNEESEEEEEVETHQVDRTVAWDL
jgi:hypothetical protein